MSVLDRIRAFLMGDFHSAIGNWDTTGPEADEHPLVHFYEMLKASTKLEGNGSGFVNGWWSEADVAKAHPGRVGPFIVPKTLVVHTTDMLPSHFDALMTAWQTKGGNGACAHFVIGRDATQGVKQLVPINRNGNHAGGKVHGNYSLESGHGGNRALLHPNVVAVGVELHSAGRLDSTPKGWVHRDSGSVMDAKDVYVDSRKHGWHVVTPYQFAMLEALIKDLGLSGLPQGSTVVPDGSYESNGVAYYASPIRTANPCALVGHVSLDPINKSDPGPQVMDWLRSKYDA